MKIVYHCFGGAHASPTAAAIHLGILPRDRFPRLGDFRQIPFFDVLTGTQHGRLIKVGEDIMGNEIFILARRNSPELVINILKEFLKLCGEEPSDYYFVSCVQLLNPFMVTGGFSSRALGWVKFGRPIVTLGTMISYPFLVDIVKRTMEQLVQKQFVQISDQ